jgi:hypothetical protein
VQSHAPLLDKIVDQLSDVGRVLGTPEVYPQRITCFIVPLSEEDSGDAK